MSDENELLRPLFWVRSSKRSFDGFPRPVQTAMGFALFRAQLGKQHPAAKPLKGFGGRSVLEVIEDHDGDTFRTIYTVRFQNAVFVLHAFQKKSKRGIATPKQEMDLVKQRLKDAEAHYNQWVLENAGDDKKHKN